MYLLYISQNNLEVFKNHQKVGEASWDSQNLLPNLSRLKTTFSSRFRVLLSDDFINVTSLLLSHQETKKRSLIQAKFQSIITEDLSQTVWDYKIVANLGKQKLVQLVYVSKNFFEQFRSAITSAKIKINLLESFSTGICHFLPKKKLVFLNYQNLLVLSFNQTPIFSKVISQKITQEDIDEVFSYSKDRFKSLPQQILFSPVGDVAFNQFDFNNLQPEYTSVDPIKGIIHSSNVHGSDESTSRLEINNQASKKSFSKIVLIIPALFLIIGSIIFFGSKLKPKNVDQINPVISVIPTITTIPTTIPISTLKIQVLNGSGIAGQATKIVNLLSKDNFIVDQTGNATNFDFTQTQIQIKSNISQDVVSLLTKSISDEFTSTISAVKLDETGVFDIIITTGK